MPAQAKIHRNVLTQQRAACLTAAQAAQEPFASQYKDIVRQCDEALAALPADDQPVEDKHNTALASLFVSSNGLCMLLNSALETERRNSGSAVQTEITRRVTAGELFTKDSLASAVQSEIKKLTDAGEYVPKATVTQLCSEAKTNGLTEGETRVRNEMAAKAAAEQKIAERKTALQTAGFPVPETDMEKFLGGTDEEFNARRTRAQTRQEALKTQGYVIQSAHLLTNLWREDAEYKAFEKTIEEIPALKSNADPLAVGSPKAAPTLMI